MINRAVAAIYEQKEQHFLNFYSLSVSSELDNVEGISVDWIGNNLFWTNDGYRKTISAARLDRPSQTRKTLLEGNMSHPRAIVVDPLNG